MMYANFFIRKILREECRERDSNPHSHYWPRDFKSLVSTNSTIAASSGAENGTRTRDPNLGKVVLYQLSYFRNFRFRF